MALVTKYIREGQVYTREYIKQHFEFGKDEDFSDFIRQLKKYRILKTVKGKNSNEEDEALLDENDTDYVGEVLDDASILYLFRYVGILVCKSRVIYVYPKYIETNTSRIPRKEMCQVINVMRKYGKTRKEIIKAYTGKEGKSELNFLSLMIYFIQDYIDNGIYFNEEDIIDINGNSEILWQKTIDETYPILKNNKPYYTELYTAGKEIHEEEYIYRLHSWIVTDCMKHMKESGLSDIYNYPDIDISSEKKSDFGSESFIIYQIENELRIQFDDRKIMLLNAMKTYIEMCNYMKSGDKVMLLLGTRSFHVVWEAVCSEVFDSQKNDKLSKIGSSYNPVRDYVIDNPATENKELIELIKKPRWNYAGADREPKDTFIPDFLSFYQEKGKVYYYILDAKYYCPELNGNQIRKNPGVEDVTKQYMYYLAFKYFLDDMSIDSKFVRNYFLMPKESGSIEDIGYVELELWKGIPSVPELVRVKKLPADLMYETYIKGDTISLKELDI